MKPAGLVADQLGELLIASLASPGFLQYRSGRKLRLTVEKAEGAGAPG